MKTRAIIPLAIGLALGVFAVKYFVNMVKNAKGATSTETVQIVFSNVDVVPTVELKENMVDVKSLPKALAPKMYIADKKEVVGRVTSLPIAAGMPIVPSLLAPKGTLPGLTVRIKDGLRAVSVQVDESAGVAGWVKSGSRVDVVAVLSGRNGSQTETISKVILQNIEVLAVGQEGGTKSETGAALAKSVTLAVTPAEVPKLHLAATKGKIRLAMRNQADEETQKKVAETTDNELLGMPENPVGKSTAGFLNGLLTKLPKPDPKATDKELRTQQAPQPAPLVVAAVPKIHRVEVIEGTRVYDVLFEGEGANLKRISSDDEARPKNPIAGIKAAAGLLNPALSGN